jgi:uncharacterized protein YraI
VTLPTTNLNAKVLVNILNIRSGPATSYTNLGKLQKDATVNVKNLDGTDTWVQFDNGKWAASNYGGQRFLDTLPGNPFKVRSLVDHLNVRSGPATTYGSLGKLNTGDVVNVTGISGKDAWIQFDSGKWAAFTHNNDKYCQLV